MSETRVLRVPRSTCPSRHALHTRLKNSRPFTEPSGGGGGRHSTVPSVLEYLMRLAL